MKYDDKETLHELRPAGGRTCVEVSFLLTQLVSTVLYTSSRSQEIGCVPPARISGSSLQSSVSFFNLFIFIICIKKKPKGLCC